MKLDVKLKFFAVVVVCASVLALVVRLLVFPEMTWIFQIQTFFFSLVVFSLVVVVFLSIHNLLNKYLAFSTGVVRRVVIQIVIGLIFMYTFRGVLVLFAKGQVEVNFTKHFILAIFIVDLFVCLAITFGLISEHFFQNWKESFEKAQRLEKEKALVQYDNLKNQLNPHFLFNALTSLNTLIYEDQDQASQFLKQLSKVYRYLLENKDLVPLHKEIEFARNYIKLLKTRFDKALKVDITIEDKYLDYQIVPITIQNLLENAIKHNILIQAKPLTIHIFSKDGYLCVENNIQKKSLVQTSNKQGMDNLKNLYKYLTSKKIVVEDTSDKFVVKVPLI